MRRAAALLMAGAALWVVALTSDTAAALQTLRRLGASPEFVSAALQAELGRVQAEGPAGTLDGWAMAVLGQSGLLSAGEEAVADYLADQRPEESTAAEEPEASLPAESQPPPQETAGQPEAVERTITGDSGNAGAEDISIRNDTAITLDMDKVMARQVELELGDGPQILIMHTHGSEAYTMDGEDVYEPSDSYRTTDNQYNVVRVGEEMKAVFESMGLEVIHDTTLYDYPGYNGSYDRSLEGVRSCLEQYPTIRIVLDVHRDALIAEDGTNYKTVSEVNGEKVAQVMMVIGSSDSGLEHPNWPQNLALAVRVQRELNQLGDTLARPINLRSARFNQQLSTGSLLVEVGTNGNTLQEAIRGARLFAQAAGEVFLSLRK